MKNLFESMSLRRVRLIFTILFVFTAVLCTINAEFILFRHATSNDQCAWREIPGNDTLYLITDIVPGGVADKAGLKNGDILVRINGFNITSNPLDTSRVQPMNIINDIPKGGYVTYLVERNGELFETKVQVLKVFDYVYASNYIFGFVFLIAGYIVVITKPAGKTQRMFAYFTISLMLLFGLAPLLIQHYEFNIVLYITIIIASVASRIIGPSILLNFFYYFPVYKKTKFNKILLFVIAGINTVIVLINLIFSSELNQFLSSVQYGKFFPLRTLFGNLIYIYFIAGLGIFFYRTFTIVPPRRRKQLLPIAVCSIIGIAVYIYTLQVNLSNQFTIFLEPENLLQYLLIILIPLSFVYSIFKYRLMDISLLIRKSLIYGMITAALAALYVLLVFVAGDAFGNMIGQDEKAPISILAIIIIAFIFDPLKRVVQDYVDRFFYREKSNYQKALLDFSKHLPLQTDIDKILNSVADTISSAMHVDKIAVVLFNKKGNKIVSRNIPLEFLQFNGQHDGVKKYLEECSEPQSTCVLKEEFIQSIDKKDLEFLSDAGIEVTIPLMFNEKLIGMINTGKKLSDREYSQDEMHLLMTVANQTAVAVENSRLYEKEKSFYKIQHELKLASQIQTEWLPKSSPEIDGYDICGFTIPARIVGGDFFDYINIDENRLAVCLGDVSGKGLHAALLLANLQAVLRTQTSQSASTAETIDKINKLLYSRTSDNMFVTMFYSELDIKNSVLYYTNAGHNFPLVFKESGNLIMLKSGGTVLGIDYNSGYVQDKITLKSNDLIVIYSDGITEQFDSEGNMFGEKKLIELVKNNKDKNSSKLCNIIFNEVTKFRKEVELSDDMTLITLKKL